MTTQDFYASLGKETNLKKEDVEVWLKNLSREAATSIRQNKTFTIDGIGVFNATSVSGTIEFQPSEQLLKRVR